MATSVKPDIVTVLEFHGFDLPLYRNPNGVKVRCLYHGDREASAVLNEKEQRYVCFSCPRKGDSWSLLMQENGLTFREAIDFAVEQGWVQRGEDGELVGGVANASTESTTSPRRSRERLSRRLRRR